MNDGKGQAVVRGVGNVKFYTCMAPDVKEAVGADPQGHPEETASVPPRLRAGTPARASVTYSSWGTGVHPTWPAAIEVEWYRMFLNVRALHVPLL